MNKKLIAAAVAATIAAPATVLANASWYARVNTAIDMQDPADGDSTTDISGVAPRFGVRYSNDLGNGLSVNGQYEWRTTTDRGDGDARVRIAKVGIGGGFGKVEVGQQWSSYFNTFGTLISPTYSLGFYVYTGVGGGLYRTANTIKYSNSFGPVYVEVDGRFDESGDGEGDGIGAGFSVPLTDNLTLAAAFDSADNGDLDDTERRGIAFKFNFGNMSITAGQQSHESSSEAVTPQAGLQIDPAGATSPIAVGGEAADGNREITPDIEGKDATDGAEVDTTFFYLQGSLGENTSWLLGTSEGSSDDVAAADDTSQTTWGIYHNLGGGMRLYYEAVDVETSKELTHHLFGMRIDF